MSRINEALKQTPEPFRKRLPEPNQELFAPAWRISPAGREVASPGASKLDGSAPLGLSRSAPDHYGPAPVPADWRARFVGGPGGDPLMVEQFRRLAAVLHEAHQTQQLRSLMVTSARPGDGKTLTTLNLALVLAESYRYDVLLVDADLRRPSILSVLDLTHGHGLSEALRAPSEQTLSLVSLGQRLSVLPAGQPIANSIEALTSPRMHQIMNEAASRFDWVLLDSPPVGSVTDSHLLSRMVGGTLFVVRAGVTPYPEVESAVEALGRENILGVVLNGAESVSAGRYYGYHTQS